MASMEFTYSVRVASGLKNRIKKEIVDSVESSPELRKEIARVFQQANRRIQNVQKTGLFSPAVAALNKGDITGYTKFSMRGSWTELKEEYAKAVSFLNQPTSQASGVREYAKQVKQKYDLTDDEYQLMCDNYMGKLSSLSDSEYIENYWKRYRDFTGEFEASFKSSSEQMESEAVQLANALQKSIESQADRVAQETEDFTVDRLQALFDAFGV